MDIGIGALSGRPCGSASSSDAGSAHQASSTAPPLTYLPAIDGLRAISVVCILLFHLDRRILSGAFVAIDVYFVISGYLITSILTSDLDRGRFSIARFYQRRIARIFPAFALVLVATLAAGTVIYQARGLGALGTDTAATALSLSNFNLLSHGSYWQLPADGQPILHYWTLALEEQFYLFFPIFLLIVMRFVRRPIAATLLMTGLSFMLCILVTARAPTLAYYMLPTRAWELLAGSCLAQIRRHGFRLDERGQGIAIWSGAVLLAATMMVFDPGMAFPGWIASLPVLATALMLIAIDNRRFLPVRLLAAPGPVWIGRLSYSLYLWHWPVFSFIDFRLLTAGVLARTALKLALTLGLSVVTFYWVEQPLRTWFSEPRRRTLTFAGFLLLSAAICLGGVLVVRENAIDATPANVATGGLHFAGSGTGTVMLVGDSQASMYTRALTALGRTRGFTLDVLSISGGTELPGTALWPGVLKAVAARRPDVIVMAHQWSTKLPDGPAELQTALAQLAPYTGTIILVAQPPVLPEGATREAIRRGNRPPFREREVQRKRRLESDAAVRSVSGGKVRFLAIEPLFAAPDGTIRVFGANGDMLYQNLSHLAEPGARLVVGQLDKPLSEAIRLRHETAPQESGAVTP